MTKQLILQIIKDCVPCGTDKGSTQGVIDTRYFEKASDMIFEALKLENHVQEELEKKPICKSCGHFKSECRCYEYSRTKFLNQEF